MSFACRTARRAAIELRNSQFRLAHASRSRLSAKCLLKRPVTAPAAQFQRPLHVSSQRLQQQQQSETVSSSEGQAVASGLPPPDAESQLDQPSTWGMVDLSSPPEAPLQPEEPQQPELWRQLRHYIEIPLTQFEGREEILGYFPQRKSTLIQLRNEMVRFDNVFLRDACQCPQCVDPSTRQKLFRTTDIHPSVFMKQIAIREGRLHVLWSDLETIERGKLDKLVRKGTRSFAGKPKSEKEKDALVGHHSIYDFEFLWKYRKPRSILGKSNKSGKQILWGKKQMENDVLRLDFEKYMTSDEAYWKFLSHMEEYGLAFLTGVPEDEKSVEKIVERIGNLKDTFYGRTWDVRNVPDPKNIAYTSKDLGLHMDLLYFESPPGLQFLHCLRNSATGGHSVYSDSFRAAETLRLQNPNLFQTLTRFPVTFHYRNDNRHYRFARPTIVPEQPYDYDNSKDQVRLSHTNYAPPFQGPFEVDHLGEKVGQGSEWRKFHVALKVFEELLEKEENKYTTLLRPGDCAIFANRRVLHARTEFDPNSGERWFKGAYCDIDAFRSAYRVMKGRMVQESREGEE